MVRLTRRRFLNSAAMAGVGARISPDLTMDLKTKLEADLSRDRAGSAPGGRPAPRRTSFDDGWRFQPGDPEGASRPEFEDRGWRAVDLPHDWSIEGAFTPDAPARGNGAYLPAGLGWYRKSFPTTAAMAGRRVAIEFDGVYQRSEVWINGVRLGMRPNGFVSFAYDLTPHLAPASRTNTIAVRVDNSLQPNCRWYSGSGIYRHTWLRVTDPVHIAPCGVFVCTPEAGPQRARVAVTTRMVNEGPHPAEVELTGEILDPSGAVVGRASSTHAVAPGGEVLAESAFILDAPRLWSGERPELYRLRSALAAGGGEVDAVTTSFGVRSVVFDPDRGLLLNGRRVKMNGVCIHGDGGSVGAAVPERVWERRLELLREMGANAIRMSHNPPAPELLDLMDRMGFLVMDEAFDEWMQPKGQTPQFGYHRYFEEWSERDLTAMVERDRNHPCVVLWSLGNEVPDQSDPEGPARLRRLREILRRSDPTRMITVACDRIEAEPKAALPEFLDELDVVGYNYVDRWRDRRERFYGIDRQRYPARRFVGTESPTVFGARGVYAGDQSSPLFFERTSNAEIEVEQLERFIQTWDYVSGDFIWTGIDYLGEAMWPNKLAATGPLDTCGFKKDTFYFYQSLWTDRPVLHLSPHWSWPGREGAVIPVTCFTNLDTVELLVNGKSYGVKGFAFPRPGMTETYGHYPPRARVLQTTADLHLSWDVVYEPGVLSARGTKDGQVVQTVEIHTAGPAERLELTVDRGRIGTGRGEVAHATVRVLDSGGRLVPTAAHPIRFAIAGEGRIIGVDNGRPDSHEAYKADSRTAFNGMALAIVQSNGRPGAMTLTARSDGLSPATVAVQILTQAQIEAQPQSEVSRVGP